MSDQAVLLRDLMQQRFIGPSPGRDQETEQAISIAFASGKGGVGKTLTALNTGIALATLGHRTCLVDANFSLGNLDLLCDLSIRWQLADCLAGRQRLEDILVEGPAGLSLLAAGADFFQSLTRTSSEANDPELNKGYSQLLSSHDFLLFDTPCGLQRDVQSFLQTVDIVCLLTSAEPTSIAESYTLLKSLAQSSCPPHLELVINGQESQGSASSVAHRLQRTCETFLECRPSFGGFIPHDSLVPQSILERRPIRVDYPQSPSGRAFGKLAQRMANLKQTCKGLGRWLPTAAHHGSAPLETMAIAG